MEAVEVKERPILFSGPMVRALLDGRKTQTRRVMKSQPCECGELRVDDFVPALVNRHGDHFPGAAIFGAYCQCGDWGARCRYGRPGDRLWVREAWNYEAHDLVSMTSEMLAPVVRYPADDTVIAHKSHLVHCDTCWKGAQLGRQRPSIHMPRWASRIALEVAEIRVQRVQDISEADAMAEGMQRFDLKENGVIYGPNNGCKGNLVSGSARGAFEALWCEINGADSWHQNPWVWCVTFKRV